MAEQVGAGLTEAGLGEHARLERRDETAESRQRSGEVFLA